MRIPILILASLVAGCSQDPGSEQRTATQATREGASVSPSAPSRGEAGVKIGGSALPARAAIDGDWAATPALCEGGRWHFSEGGTKVATAGETSCIFADPVVLPGGRTQVAGQCLAEGTPGVERWTWQIEGERLAIRREPQGAPPIELELARCVTP